MADDNSKQKWASEGPTGCLEVMTGGPSSLIRDQGRIASGDADKSEGSGWHAALAGRNYYEAPQ